MKNVIGIIIVFIVICTSSYSQDGLILQESFQNKSFSIADVDLSLETNNQFNITSNKYLIPTIKKKKKTKQIIGISLAVVGVAQMVAGIGIMATNPGEAHMDMYGNTTYTPTTASGMGGFLLAFNGVAMTSIGVKLAIPTSKRRAGHGSGRKKRRR